MTLWLDNKHLSKTEVDMLYREQFEDIWNVYSDKILIEADSYTIKHADNHWNEEWNDLIKLDPLITRDGKLLSILHGSSRRLLVLSILGTIGRRKDSAYSIYGAACIRYGSMPYYYWLDREYFNTMKEEKINSMLLAKAISKSRLLLT